MCLQSPSIEGLLLPRPDREKCMKNHQKAWLDLDSYKRVGYVPTYRVGWTIL